jgi:hypothetical protein
VTVHTHSEGITEPVVCECVNYAEVLAHGDPVHGLEHVEDHLETSAQESACLVVDVRAEALGVLRPAVAHDEDVRLGTVLRIRRIYTANIVSILNDYR